MTCRVIHYKAASSSKHQVAAESRPQPWWETHGLHLARLVSCTEMHWAHFKSTTTAYARCDGTLFDRRRGNLVKTSEKERKQKGTSMILPDIEALSLRGGCWFFVFHTLVVRSVCQWFGSIYALISIRKIMASTNLEQHHFQRENSWILRYFTSQKMTVAWRRI